MVHNGIEYGIMQLIAETYDLMRRGLGLSNDELHRVYDDWNRAELESYLLQITSRIFLKKDERTGGRLIDLILDEAEQKGTGKWTSQDAMNLGIPVPNHGRSRVDEGTFRLEEDRREGRCHSGRTGPQNSVGTGRPFRAL